ncbi:recombinase family protein [Halobacteria archaeon AArc-curdl1]|uniref:Recombinase family protein n=1 Tax=Natronosalvus hydrolyticus TaxID=2979988 RepID=A0AAP3E784_9EURY|nr:recombinase family protein [Halobacteria archaeon AArc-curdl1]
MVVAGGLVYLIVGEKAGMLPLLFGIMRRDEVEGDRWGLIARVSTGPQMKSESTDRQLENLRKEVEASDGTIKKEFEVAESAATVNRESLDKVATLAEDNEIDVVGVSKLDRLTRADPWETFDYLKRLREAEATLYADTHGYFDWDDLYDFPMLVRQVVFSREWYQRIRDNARDGQVDKLVQGKWPFGKPPFGYLKDDKGYVHLTEIGKEIIPEIFKLYVRKENRAEVKRIINDRYDLEDPLTDAEEDLLSDTQKDLIKDSEEDSLSDSQIKTILQSRLCMGQLALEGEVISDEPQLAVIDLEIFNGAQELLEDNSSTPSGTRAIPEPIERTARRFGEEYVLTLIDSIDTRCRKCRGEIEPNGDIERWGIKLKNYVCQECNHQGPLLTQEEFNELHDTLPLRCPSCPETETFEIEENQGGDWEYSYTCSHCDNSFGSDLLPGKYRRAFELPDLAFDCVDDGSDDQEPTDPEDDEDADDDSDLSQATFTDF